MDVLDKKNPEQLMASLVGELAKATNELRCARQDVEKAQGRLTFALVLANELINRKRD
jgi:hypothetical protein